MENNHNVSEYEIKTADWRSSLRTNNERTIFVIALFFLIYLSLGLLIDVLIYAELTQGKIPLSNIFFNLISFTWSPKITYIMLFIASISLLVSYLWHNKLILLGTDYHEIRPDDNLTLEEKQFYNIISELKIAAGLNYMPRVYIINADYMNAFASGFSEKSALVAITRGLLQKLTRDEIAAVMAHEISHIKHLDIKLTLTASLLANLTIIVLDILFRGVLNAKSRGKNSPLMIVIVILRFVLPLITALLLLYLSRTRELMADAGSVKLMRTSEPLASALIKIHQDYAENQEIYSAQLAQTLHEGVRKEAYLFNPSQANISTLINLNDLFATHPSLEKRLNALGFIRKNKA